MALLLPAVTASLVLVGRDLLLRVTGLPEETTSAAIQVLAMAAAALCALAIGLGALALRLWVTKPIEELTRQAQLPAGDEVPALRQHIDTLQRELEQAKGRERGSLDAVQTLLDRESETLAKQDRQAITGQLALGVAHELGSPLTVAMGCADTLEAQDQPELLESLQQALERVHGVLEQFNDFGLDRDGDGDNCDVVAVAQETAELARLHPKCRSVSLTYPATESPVDAQLPRGHLRQILLNLVINAADAIGERGGKIAIACARRDERVDIWVDDDGPGVPAQLQESIFDAFVSGKTSNRGTGLGLSVSRRLVERAGGTLTVTDSPLGGARFELTLPA